MELLIVRHAESEPNVAGIINADPERPSPLTPLGRRQAEERARLLSGKPIDLCVTSGLERSIATADVLLTGRAIEPRVMAELDDARAGDFEGRPAVEHQRWLAVNGLGVPNPSSRAVLKTSSATSGCSTGATTASPWCTAPCASSRSACGA
jgi:hypothetical protein